MHALSELFTDHGCVLKVHGAECMPGTQLVAVPQRIIQEPRDEAEVSPAEQAAAQRFQLRLREVEGHLHADLL